MRKLKNPRGKNTASIKEKTSVLEKNLLKEEGRGEEEKGQENGGGGE